MSEPKTNNGEYLLEQSLEGNMGRDAKLIASTGVQWTLGILRKNLDYGSSVWHSPVLADGLDPGMAIRVRMSDKISRLQSLLSVKQPAGRRVKDESIDDTIADLGAYCLLYLARPKVEADKP